MAILEVHDGRGRVERVVLTRDEPFIFGSSTACSVVIDEPSVAPVHGRIRWKKRKFKLDAGADVESIDLNGKRIKSSSLYQGDEIRVGSTRIFVISTEDANEPPEDDKTRVQAAPKAMGSPVATVSKRSRGVFEGDAVARALDLPSRPEPLKRSRAWRKELQNSEPSEAAVPATKPGFGGWVRSRMAPASDAPGQERVISSPMVVGLAITLVILIVASFGLWRVIVKASAQKQYTKAFDTLNEGDYRNAIKQLDAFLAAFPDDPRSNKARVYQALAKVRQFTSNTGASWENAFQAAQSMVAEVGQLDEYRDASTELAEQVVKTVEGLADRARAAADPAALVEAEAALAFCERVAGKAEENLLSRSRALPKLAQAREAIRRAETKARAITAMNAAISGNSASGAYTARDELVTAYPDLAQDRDLLAGMLKANEIVRKAVSYDPSQRPGETEPHPDPLGPPTSLVLRLDPGSPASKEGEVVYAIADGLAFGLDSVTGAPLWQSPVGLSSPFPPVPIIGGGPSALVIDARYDELVRVDGRTGKTVWRQTLGEAVNEPPMVSGNSAIVATPGGKILFLDLANGGLRGTLNLGRPLTKAPVADESGSHLYVLGDEDCLFVLDRDPPACARVEYLGHPSGSIAATPTRVGRFLIVLENRSIKDGVWRVFGLGEDGIKITARQSIPVAGWTWQSPPSSGSVLWSASDRGEIVAYSIGRDEDQNPVKPIASIAADNLASGPAYGLARSARELWVGSGRPTRYDLNDESGKLAVTWVVSPSGPALGPVQVTAKLAVFTQQSLDGPGVALAGVDPRNGSLRWRTTLGAPWPLPFIEGKEPGSIRSLGFDGKPSLISRERLETGGFVEQALSKTGEFRVPSLGAGWLTCGDTTVLIPSPTSDHMLVQSGNNPFRAIDLPSPLGAHPIAWGKDVLVPGGDGRIYLIDATSGEFAADPYVPRFDRAHPSRWRDPVLVDGDAVILSDEEGHLRRLSKALQPRPHLVVSAETSLGKPVVAGPASTGAAVLLATADGKVRALAARDLSPTSSIDLASPRSFGPVAVGGLGFVSDATGNVFAFSADGRKLWNTKLRAPMANTPALLDGVGWFPTRTRAIEARNLADGAWIERLTIGFPPAGPPIAAGNSLLVPSGLGSLRPIASGRNPKSTDASGN
jgi:outer membrane protein assembly factor BamB